MTRRTRPRRVKAVATATTSGIYSPGDAIWSLPRTAAAYDAMVEQVAAAIGTHSYRHCKWSDIHERSRQYYRMEAGYALSAIGITRPKEDKP